MDPSSGPSTLPPFSDARSTPFASHSGYPVSSSSSSSVPIHGVPPSSSSSSSSFHFSSPPPDLGSKSSHSTSHPTRSGGTGGISIGGSGFPSDSFSSSALLTGMAAAQALHGGQHHVSSWLGRVASWFRMEHARSYFLVSHAYVLAKLTALLFPFRKSLYERKSQVAPESGSIQHPPPRLDSSSPDLYIPLMAFLSYILLEAFVSGAQGRFTPEVFGKSLWYGILWGLLEIVLYRIGLAFVPPPSNPPVVEVVATLGYKYVCCVLRFCDPRLFLFLNHSTIPSESVILGLVFLFFDRLGFWVFGIYFVLCSVFFTAKSFFSLLGISHTGGGLHHKSHSMLLLTALSWSMGAGSALQVLWLGFV